MQISILKKCKIIPILTNVNRGGVIIKVFLISPLYLVRLCTLSGFAACPGTHASPRAISVCYVRVRTRPRVLYPCALPIQNVVMSSFARPSLALRSSFALPSLILRSPFAQLFSTKISKHCPSLFSS